MAPSHEESELANLSIAVSEYAVRHSAALIVRDRHHATYLGSATCVRIGDDFLLATAGHNLDDVTHPESIRICPPLQGIGEWLPIAAVHSTSHRGRSSIDLAWLQIDPGVAAANGLSAVGLSDLVPYEIPRPGRYYHVQGLPAAQADVQDSPQLLSISLTSLGYLTFPSDTQPADPRVDLPVDYGAEAVSATLGVDVALANPKGLSGGGIWLVPPSRSGIWLPGVIRLAGVIRDHQKSLNQLTGVQIQHWLTLVATDHPHLTAEIERHLSSFRTDP